jgi:hypothetical protein
LNIFILLWFVVLSIVFIKGLLNDKSLIYQLYVRAYVQRHTKHRSSTTIFMGHGNYRAQEYEKSLIQRRNIMLSLFIALLIIGVIGLIVNLVGHTSYFFRDTLNN